MKKHTQIHPMLPGFYLPNRGRKPRSSPQVLATNLASVKKKTFKQVGEIFSPYLPLAALGKEKSGVMSRHRLFSKENTFWAFLGQVFDSDRSCSGVVRKLQAYATSRGLKLPSSSTASYCTARQNLDEATLLEIFQHTTRWANATQVSEMLNGRRVIVVDGTGVSMPDTPANQACWPQSSNQKEGCGFPSSRICALFSLDNCGLLSYTVGNKKSHELPLFRKNWSTFKRGDIFLGDKGFCSYFDIAKLLNQDVDSVVTLARRKPVGRKQCYKELGNDDLLVSVHPETKILRVRQARFLFEGRERTEPQFGIALL